MVVANICSVFHLQQHILYETTIPHVVCTGSQLVVMGPNTTLYIN